jgi:hypothetical protein
MTSNYRDFTSYVSSSAVANEYTTLNNYSNNGFKEVPQFSMMKLSVAPGGEKYFSAAPSFQSRTDSVRIPAPSMTPIGITSHPEVPSGSVMMSTEGNKQVSSSDYAFIGGAYTLNPM